MNDVLDNAITGGPVMVTIGGREHPLQFRMASVLAYKARTGESLFDPAAWSKIDLKQNPDLWLACLWAGLHQEQPDRSWKAPYTFEELSGLIDFRLREVSQLAQHLAKAFARYFPASDPAPASAGGQNNDGKKNGGDDAATMSSLPASTNSGAEPASGSD